MNRHHKRPARILAGIVAVLLISGLAFAYNPPLGGDSAIALFSPELLGGNASAAGGAFGPALPGELLVNPALSAGEQRIALDASYAAIISAGDQSGLGHVINFGALYPTRWGVLSGSFHFVTSPFDSLPLGTAGFLHAGFAKDLTDSLYMGVGLLGGVGEGWGLTGDIGLLYLAGDLGAVRDVRFGLAVTGLGRSFTPDTWGINGGNPTGYPSAFTPRLGVAATLVDVNGFKLGASTDLSLPTFQNVVFDAGLEALIKDIVTVRTGWTYNMKESSEDAQTYIPSFGIGINLKLDSTGKDTFLARNGWAQSEVTPSFGVKPLYKDLYAVGGGINARLGVKDNKAPNISFDYEKPLYISPNDDGTQDDLVVPVSVRDQRYIVAWTFTVEDESGKVIRTIANKEDRPEMRDFKSVWNALTKPKEGIVVPEAIRWDGRTDSGEVAGDGAYAFRMTAVDDNDNPGASARHTVYVDVTAPVVSVAPPSGANAMIFSPDGDGNKDTFRVAQSGSPEDLWKGEILDGSGTVVRVFETKDASPAEAVWDGKTDAGTIAPDGVYSWRISSTDRAGNAVAARVDNIIVDTVKPAINVTIDTAHFSPNGDGTTDAVTLTPSIPVLAGLSGWEMTIVSRAGAVQRAFSGTGAVKPLAYDGTSDSGARLAEGEYQAILSAKYVNGHSPVAKSPFFTVDVTPPEARVRASGPIFSPVGDGKLDTVSFTQQASREESWLGQVFALDASGKPSGQALRSFRFGPVPDATASWDGRDESGKLAPDGKYGYRLTASDLAGNSGSSNLAVIELNTEKADVILQANHSAFSPNGDGSKDAIVFTPVIKASTAVERYALVVSDKSGKAVKTFSGTGRVPATLSWNGLADPATGATAGERSPDGVYSATLEVTLVNQQTSRSAAPDFVIDTRFPSIEISAPWIVFSPNGDGKRDALPVTQKSSKEELWSSSIVNERKQVVRSWKWEGEVANVEWDATDNSGNRVPDGTYAYVAQSEDRAGNRTTQQLAGIVVDARVPKAYVTVQHPAFSPNGDGVKDTQRVSLVTNVAERLASWNVSIRPESSGKGSAKTASVKSWSSAESATLPAVINWDGLDSSGNVAQGKFVAELSLSYEKGDEVTATSAAFLSNAKAPSLGVRLDPKYFSPDNDGLDDELFIALSAESAAAIAEWSFEIREPEGTAGNVFWKTGGSDKIADRIVWDGRSLKGELVQAATDYPFTFTVRDEVGMTSVVRGYVPVDVLVIRDGNRLKIAVPSIIFRENAADFNGLDKAVVDKNVQVLKRIAEILNKFRDYRIQVEGHANNVTGTQREEDAELIPLSRQRSDAVRDFLVRNGVDGGRLSTVGLGGTKPVVQRGDRENWWKNRRVEFILLK